VFSVSNTILVPHNNIQSTVESLLKPFNCCLNKHKWTAIITAV
jgi:hypothetical protein